MTERKGVTPNTGRRTIAVRLTLLLTLLASCLTFAPAASAQVWQSDLKVAHVGRDLGLDSMLIAPATGCDYRWLPPCSTQLSNPSFRFPGRESPYEILSMIVSPWGDGLFLSVAIARENRRLLGGWPRESLAEPWKLCVNNTAFFLPDFGKFSSVFFGEGWPYPHDAWEIGDSVRLAITSGPCP